jgi:hypothetical protein
MTRAGVPGWGGPPRHTPSCRLARGLPARDARSVFADRPPSPGSGLHLCCLCHADCVVPVTWDEVDDQHWRMLLRCAECETYRRVVVGNDVARRYEADLQRGMDEIASTLERSERRRMVEEVGTLIQALRRDLIDAADFASP